MALPFAVALDNATAVVSVAAGEDLVTTTTHATRSLTVREFQFSGLGTASAANQITVNRVTTLGSTPVAITPRPLNSNSAAAGFTAASDWTTHPVATAGTLMRFGLNVNGALFRWVAAPGLGIDCPAGAVAAGQLSFRLNAGATGSTITYYVIVDEN
jgi:hypothetical protein